MYVYVCLYIRIMSFLVKIRSVLMYAWAIVYIFCIIPTHEPLLWFVIVYNNNIFHPMMYTSKVMVEVVPVKDVHQILLSFPIEDLSQHYESKVCTCIILCIHTYICVLAYVCVYIHTYIYLHST